MTKVLVTGASGYIAKHIVLQLLQAGYEVRASIRSQQRAAEIHQALLPLLGPTFDLQSRLTFVELNLSSDSGWEAALEDIDVLIHTASPFPSTSPANEDDLIRPAVDGTLRALKAASRNSLKRVVLTSSTAAVVYGERRQSDSPFDESHWTDIHHRACSAYSKSKTLAERAAWEFVASEASDINLTCINPGFVFGPPLDDNFGTSMEAVARLIAGKDPALPRLGFACVDVRDVASAHIRAIDRPATFDKRILAVSGFLWLHEIAAAIKQAFPERRIATRIAPDWLFRLLGPFNSQARGIVPLLGMQFQISNERARDLLDMEFRDPRQSAVESATYLMDRKNTS